MQKITPFLWFDNNAEEAIHFYTSIFRDSKIVSTAPGPDGKVMTGRFELLGDPDHEKAGRVLQAMLGMKKINIADLKKAYEGRL